MLKRWVTAKHLRELVITLFEHIWIKRDPGKMFEIYLSRKTNKWSSYWAQGNCRKIRKNVSTVSGEYSEVSFGYYSYISVPLITSNMTPYTLHNTLHFNGSDESIRSQNSPLPWPTPLIGMLDISDLCSVWVSISSDVYRQFWKLLFKKKLC